MSVGRNLLQMLLVTPRMQSILVSSFCSENETSHSAACEGWSGGGIYQITMDEERPNLVRLAGCSFPHIFVMDHQRQILWTNDSPVFDEGEEFVVGFQRQSAGSWSECARVSSEGQAPCHLSVAGSQLLAANYSSGNVVSWTIGPDGSLSNSTVRQHSGSSIHPDRQQAPFAHCIHAVPDSQRVMAADLGADRIFVYECSAESPLEPKPEESLILPPGSGPRHLTYSPCGRHLYVVNELGNSVTHFSRDPADRWFPGANVSTIPADFDGASFCADVCVTKCGRFLFATNRGHDSIVCFEIQPDGTPRRQQIVSSRGAGPQNLLLTKDDRQLLVANMKGHTIAAFDVHEKGRLNDCASLVLPLPSCLDHA